MQLPQGTSRLARATAVAACAVMSFQGCAHERALSGIQIRVLEQAVMLRRNAAGATFSATAVIANHATRPVYWTGCLLPMVQREIENEWVTVWTAPCSLIRTIPTTSILPGDSALVPVRVYGNVTDSSFPRLDPRMVAGTYRFVFPLSFSQEVKTRREKLPPSTTFLVQDTVIH